MKGIFILKESTINMATVSEEKLMELRIKLENNIKLSREEKKILKENDKEALEKKKGMPFRERMLQASKLDSAQLMGEHDIDKYPIRDWISTGNYLYNAQISGDPYKGVPSGRILQFSGVNSCGKCLDYEEEIEIYVDKKHLHLFQ